MSSNTVTYTAAEGRSLPVNFSWTVLGNGVYITAQWGILVLLARLGSPEAVGQFSLGLAVAAPIMLLASLQLRAVQATDARLQFQFSDYAGLRILTTSLAAVLIFAIGGTLYRGTTALTVAAFALSKGIESCSDLIYGLWQQQERMDLIAISLILRGMLALAAAALCLAVWHAVWIAVCGMAAVWAVVFVFYDVPLGRAVARETQQNLLPEFSAIRMRQLARLSFPLGLVTMLVSLNSSIPRYMISHFRNIRELGIFSALGYILMAGTMIIGALGQSATPRLALYAAQRRSSEFRKLLSRLLVIGLALGLSGVLAALAFGRQIVTLIYGSEYAQRAPLFVWLMAGAGTGYLASFAGYSLTAARHFQVQIPLFSFITALTLVLCYVMAKSEGSLGVAKALAIVGFVQLLGTVAVLRHMEARQGKRCA